MIYDLCDFNKSSTRPLTPLDLDNIVHFPTRDQAYLDHVYVNHTSLFATRRRAPLSTSDHAIIRIMPKIYSKEHHQAFIRRSCRASSGSEQHCQQPIHARSYRILNI